MEDTHVLSSRENNFNTIRFVAALLVIAGHMGHLVSVPIPTFLNQQVHSLGVKIFFLVGGYLITKSWLSDPHPARYICKRVFRIFPALIVFVLLMVFVAGPLLTNLPIKDYFANPNTYFYLNNIRLFINFGLPGVFENNPAQSSMNGSLWTLPVEFFMYLILPIILVITGARKQNKRSAFFRIAITVMLAAVALLRLQFFPSWWMVVYGTSVGDAIHLMVYYLICSVYALPFVKKYLNLQVAVIFVLFASCFFMSPAKSEAVLYLVLPYLVFSFALSPTPFFAKAFKKGDYSYGVYIYGFFVQQLLISIFLHKRNHAKRNCLFSVKCCNYNGICHCLLSSDRKAGTELMQICIKYVSPITKGEYK